jgi:anti-sigma factor RsiW
VNQEVNFMDCAQFEEIIQDLERPGTEGFALRDNALEHAESCSHCARLMTDAESLDAALREIARSEASKLAPARVETALMGEFRRQKRASSHRRVQRQIAALAVAAVVLLVLGISLHPWTTRNPTIAPVANVAGNISSSPTNPAVAPPVNSQQQEQESANQAGDSEYATAFVPLPYADDPTAVDGGTVVRVILSRPALASLGVPITDPGATDRIPADLLLSEDGAPQAIRLVSQTRTDD